MDDAAAGRSSRPMTSRSGSHRAVVDDAAADPISRPTTSNSGSHGAVVDDSAAADSSSSDRSRITNPWNLFQHQNRKKGLTSSTLAVLYRDQKSKKP